MTNKNKYQLRAIWLTDMRVRKAAIIIAPLMLISMLSLLPSAHAVDSHIGWNGTLYVQGALTESACRLDMDSAYQDVNLGDIGTGRLQKVGSRGEPVRIELRLADCVHSTIGSQDASSNPLTWSRNAPEMTVSFIAARDEDNPQLVKARGVAGIGLRLANGRGQDINLGNQGQPLLLITGQNILSYTLAVERTSAPLVAGSYRSAVDFFLSYD